MQTEISTMNDHSKRLAPALSVASAMATVAGIASAFLFGGTVAGQIFVVSLALLAVRMQFSTQWNTFAFTFWVLAFVVQAFCVPAMFLDWPMGPAKDYIPPLIQIIMFGMGTTLSLNDFARVLKVPKSVAIGMLLQFTVMPIAGWALAKIVGFPPEIAAGVVLIGSCPGGVASNVIAYLARGDVALSVTMTACSTLMSPIMTPLAMSLLAGSTVKVEFANMMWVILEITIVPVVLGLAVSYLFQWLRWRGPWLDRCLSIIAMLAICIVIGIIVALSRDDLLKVGPLLVIVAMTHNAIGYALGYFGAIACKLDETTSRTISIEVGMQNGGMASALAMNVLNSPQAALAGAIFGPWMSISGSILASWWRKRPTQISEPSLN
jgi:bile acid:Na+ symporter, BASS family